MWNAPEIAHAALSEVTFAKEVQQLVVWQMLVPMIAAGKDLAGMTFMICSLMTKHFKSHAAELEKQTPVVRTALEEVREIMLAVLALVTTDVPDMKTLDKLTGSSSKAAVLVRNALDQNVFYREAKTTATKYHVAAAAFMPEIEEGLKTLKSATPEEVGELCRRLFAWRDALRPGLFENHIWLQHATLRMYYLTQSPS